MSVSHSFDLIETKLVWRNNKVRLYNKDENLKSVNFKICYLLVAYESDENEQERVKKSKSNPRAISDVEYSFRIDTIPVSYDFFDDRFSSVLDKIEFFIGTKTKIDHQSIKSESGAYYDNVIVQKCIGWMTEADFNRQISQALTQSK